MARLVDHDALSQFINMVFRQTSSEWQPEAQPWVGNVGKVILSAIGEGEIRFIFGSPGSYINELRTDGHLWIFTDELLADVIIEHRDQQTTFPPPTPVVTVRSVPRSNLRCLKVRDENRVLAHTDEEFGGWPARVALELDYGNSDPVSIEFSENNTNHQQRALLDLLPSLRNDLTQRSAPSGEG